MRDVGDPDAAAVLLLAGDRDGRRASRRAPRTSRRASRCARSSAERATGWKPPWSRRRRRRGSRGRSRLQPLAGRVEERAEVHASSATGRPSTCTSKRPPSTASSCGTIASPITLPSSALPADARHAARRDAVDDDLAALDRDRAGRALEADEHPAEAAVGDLLRRPLADPLELLVVLDEPRHRRLEQVRLGVGVLARRSRGPSRAGGSAAARGRTARRRGRRPLEERVPDVLGERAREVELVAELADEADPQRERGHAGDRDVLGVEVREALVRRSRRRRRAASASRAFGPATLIAASAPVRFDELDVHEPDRVPPREPLVDAVRAGRRGRRRRTSRRRAARRCRRP